MPVRLEMYAGVQETYRAPFTIVNAAVADMLSVIYVGCDLPQKQSPGITQYDPMPLLKAAQLYIQIGVLMVAEDLTTVRIRPYLQDGQTIYALLQDAAVRASLAALYNASQEIILQTMRYTYPNLTLEDIKGVTPPMPTPDKGLIALAEWKDAYLRGVNDERFSEERDISLSGLRNARREKNRDQPKVPRGRAHSKKVS